MILGYEICNSLSAVHALGGCDTTSRIHSLGVKTVLQHFLKNKEVKGLIEILSNQESGKRRVLQAGKRLLLILLGGKTEKSLDELRSRKYYDKISGHTLQAVRPESLGPIVDAAQ